MRNVNQKGAVAHVLVVLVVLVLAMGIAIAVIESRKSNQRKQAAQQAQLERQSKERAERENERRAQAERAALEKAAAAKSNDALATSLKAIDDLMLRWVDTVKVADSTSRAALSGPLTQLQAIRRETQDLAVPPCLAAGRAELVKGMDLIIQAFLDFMGHTGDLGKNLAHIGFEAATPHFERYKADRSMCPT